MSVGYAITVGVWGAVAVLALAPIRRPRPLGVGSWLLTMVVTEVPHLAICLLLYPTVLAVWSDGLLATPGGWALAAVAVAGMLCLALVARRGFRADDVVRAALTEALGGGIGPRRGRADRLRILLTPVPVRPRVVQRIPNLAFGPAGRRNRLDVYRHRSAPANAPTLVYFHGGGYFSGGKHREAQALLHRLAAAGWVCLSANYRLRPAAGFAEHLADVHRALAWAREHGPDFGADPRTVVVAGSSAGAQLAAVAALAPNADLTAAVCLYGYYGRYYGHTGSERPLSSPLDYDVAAAPPFFVAHGDNDTYVPVQGARAFVTHLRRGSRRPVVYAELPGAQHDFDLLRSVRFESVVDGVEAFLTRVRSGVTLP